MTRDERLREMRESLWHRIQYCRQEAESKKHPASQQYYRGRADAFASAFEMLAKAMAGGEGDE